MKLWGIVMLSCVTAAAAALAKQGDSDDRKHRDMDEETKPSHNVRWLHDRPRWGWFGIERTDAKEFPENLKDSSERDDWRMSWNRSHLSTLNLVLFCDNDDELNAVLGCANWGFVVLGKSHPSILNLSSYHYGIND